MGSAVNLGMGSTGIFGKVGIVSCGIGGKFGFGKEGRVILIIFLTSNLG